MKKLSSYLPFWDFSSIDEFVGYFESAEFIGDSNVARFSTSSGDEYLIGGGIISKMLTASKFIKGSQYKIVYLGKEKILNGKFKGKFFNKFDIFELDDDEEA